MGLADLIAVKLHTGMGRMQRSQDVAAVVAVIRATGIDKQFAARLPKSSRQLVRAIQQGR